MSKIIILWIQVLHMRSCPASNCFNSIQFIYTGPIQNRWHIKAIYKKSIFCFMFVYLDFAKKKIKCEYDS